MQFSIALLCVLAVVAYWGRPFWGLLSCTALALLAWGRSGIDSPWWFATSALVFAVVTMLSCRPGWRARYISRPLMAALGRVMPTISETEREALEAGTVGWDRELFSGDPDYRKLLKAERYRLTERERAFLDGPLSQLCGMLDDWSIRQSGDLPQHVWRFLEENGFFGMIIPEEYGGLGLSATAVSEVITTVATCSVAASVTVMVPNSLGPAELLMHYGTDDQKSHYLPRLADGREIPCFALTEPAAGSDAASMVSHGEVCLADDGESVGIRLNWNKRYITLAPVATVLGLAFKLSDPEHLLGSKVDLGITCALIPVELDGVEVGDRHDPLGVPFMNGPTRGRDVFVPLDAVIGGPAMVGKGWKMLMQCLAAGRGISLPALSCGAAQLACQQLSAYATVREQFKTPIRRFEGVEERLARVAGLTYAMNAARHLTSATIDSGDKPAVVTAIVKAYLTDSMRTVINDAMDIRAGAAICQGPRNVLSAIYQSLPISITVEGANILTRSLIVYGQGALRCHPFVREQVEAVGERDIARFDRALFGHIGFSVTNGVRAFFRNLLGGRLPLPPLGGPTMPYFSQLTSTSSTFVTLSDVSMAVLGGSLKRRETISGRFADAFAWMYIVSATLDEFIRNGEPEHERAFMRWASEWGLHQAQEAMSEIIDNFPIRALRVPLRLALFPIGKPLRAPSDALSADVVRSMVDDAEGRAALVTSVYMPPANEVGRGRLEEAYRRVKATAPLRARVRTAVRERTLPRLEGEALIAAALAGGIIDASEADHWRHCSLCVDDVIQVDSFASPRRLRERQRVDLELVT